MTKRFKDPVFGVLRWSDYEVWEGRRKPGSPAPLSTLWVDSRGASETPTAEQRDAYRRFVDAEGTVTGRIERELLRYYNRVKPLYREGNDEDWVEANMPDLSRPSDVWQLLEDVRLNIPLASGPGWTIKVLANSSWDMEHGIVVKVRRGKVEFVGLQGDEA